MLREIESNGRIHCRVSKIAKGRMIQECERRTREADGMRVTLSELLDDYGKSLPPMPADIERELRDGRSNEQARSL